MKVDAYHNPQNPLLGAAENVEANKVDKDIIQFLLIVRKMSEVLLILESARTNGWFQNKTAHYLRKIK